MKTSHNPFFDQCIKSTANKNFNLSELVRNKAEAALRELRDGDVDPIGLRETSDEIQTTIFEWLQKEGHLP